MTTPFLEQLRKRTAEVASAKQADQIRQQREDHERRVAADAETIFTQVKRMCLAAADEGKPGIQYTGWRGHCLTAGVTPDYAPSSPYEAPEPLRAVEGLAMDRAMKRIEAELGLKPTLEWVPDDSLYMSIDADDMPAYRPPLRSLVVRW